MTWSQFKDLLPVITFAVGLAVAWIRDDRRDKRDLDRWRAEFDRNNLLDLHDAVSRLSEMVQLVVQQKEAALQDIGIWPDRVPANDDEWAARASVLKLKVRIRLKKEDLREDLEEFTRLAARAQSEKDPKEASACAFATVSSFISLNERIGSALRSVL